MVVPRVHRQVSARGVLDDHLLGAVQLRDEAVMKRFGVREDALGNGHSETGTPVPIRVAEEVLQRFQGLIDAAVRRKNLRPQKLDLGALRYRGQHLQRLLVSLFIEQPRCENPGDERPSQESGRRFRRVRPEPGAHSSDRPRVRAQQRGVRPLCENRSRACQLWRPTHSHAGARSTRPASLRRQPDPRSRRLQRLGAPSPSSRISRRAFAARAYHRRTAARPGGSARRFSAASIGLGHGVSGATKPWPPTSDRRGCGLVVSPPAEARHEKYGSWALRTLG